MSRPEKCRAEGVASFARSIGASRSIKYRRLGRSIGTQRRREGGELCSKYKVSALRAVSAAGASVWGIKSSVLSLMS